MRHIQKNEIELDPNRYLVSETDATGVITYCNDYFCQISGYSREELLGQQHNIIRHPDMPKVVFKLLWEQIKQGKNINAVIKNRAKNGKYYWVFTTFQTRIDLDTNTVIGYTAHRKTLSDDVTNAIGNMYHQVLEVEQNLELDVDKIVPLKSFSKKYLKKSYTKKSKYYKKSKKYYKV